MNYIPDQIGVIAKKRNQKSLGRRNAARIAAPTAHDDAHGHSVFSCKPNPFNQLES